MRKNSGVTSPAHPQNSTDVPMLIVVTGPPGSGKSTIAAALRDRLGLPLIAKDGLKEVLGEALAIRGRSESQPLGAATFELLAHVVHELLENGVSVIAEGNFTAESALFGALPPARIVQVHVSAEPALLRARMLDRAAKRHPVHWDGEAADEVAERAAADEWQPLPLDGDLLEVDTTSWPDVDDVTRNVMARLGSPGSR